MDTAGLDELYDAAEKLLAGEPLDPAIGDALMNGTAIGGVHPKVLISDGSGVEHLAKLSVPTDVHLRIRAEAVAIELARLCGIEGPKAHVIKSEAGQIVERIVATVENHWSEAADAAGLSDADRSLLWKRSILNRSSFYD